MDDLVEDLERAVMQVLDGSPPGPLFASRVQRVVTETLRRRRVNATVHTTEGGTHVHVGVKDRDRVRWVSFTVHPT